MLICPGLFLKKTLSHLDNPAFFAYTKFKYRILYRQRTECFGNGSFSETGRLVKALKDAPEMLSGSPAVKAVARRSRYRTVKAVLLPKRTAQFGWYHGKLPAVRLDTDAFVPFRAEALFICPDTSAMKK